MKDVRKRAISMLLAFIMAVTLIPMGAALGSYEELNLNATFETETNGTTASEEATEEGLVDEGLAEAGPFELPPEVNIQKPEGLNQDPVAEGSAAQKELAAQEPIIVIEDSGAIHLLEQEVLAQVFSLSTGLAAGVSLPVFKGVVGVKYESSLSARSGATPITWSLASGSLPPGLKLQSNGTIIGVPTQQGYFPFVVRATNAAGSSTTSCYIDIAVKPVVTTASLAGGTVGSSYSQTLQGTGTANTKPLLWGITSGKLPPGLTLDEHSGKIYGIPTASGSYKFTVAANNTFAEGSKALSITIAASSSPQKPIITTTKDSVHAGITGINYKKTLAASGTGKIAWSRISGSLPPGLTLSNTGVISGKPTKPGAYTFKIRATNIHGNTEKSFTIKVNNPSISISYQTHVQTVGWQGFKKDGAMSGTSGKALRLEGIKINLKNNTGISGGIRYSTHVQSIGWQKKVSLNTNGKSLKDVKGPMSGTSGRALRLEAITIELTGDLKKHYDIYYRVHAQSVGWMGWARNGEQAGTAGHAYRLEGIQIVLVPKVGGKKPGNTFKGITTPPNTKSFIKK